MVHAESVYVCAGESVRSETKGVQIAPHNLLGSVSSDVCLQPAAAMENFAIMESPDPSLIGSSLNSFYLPTRSPGTHSGGSAKGRAEKTGNSPYRNGTAPHRLDTISAVRPMGSFYTLYKQKHMRKTFMRSGFVHGRGANTAHKDLCKRDTKVAAYSEIQKTAYGKLLLADQR